MKKGIMVAMIIGMILSTLPMMASAQRLRERFISPSMLALKCRSAAQYMDNPSFTGQCISSNHTQEKR